MASSSSQRPDKRMAYCRRCREEFISYNIAQTRCPLCGRPAQTALQRFVVRTIVLLVIAAVIGAAVFVFLQSR